MKYTYKVYIPDNEHGKSNLFKISDSENIKNYIFDTEECSFYKALEKAKANGFKII